MSELATWTGDVTAGSWLPDRSQRAMAAEDAHERAEARRAEIERQDREDKAHERALGAYRAAAEARGEFISAVQLAAGDGISRSIEDVFADARLASEREDGRAAARQRHQDGDVVFIDHEPRIQGASRSAWPESEYELDRMLRQADELHRDRIAYEARQASRSGHAAEHIEAQRARRPFAVRSEHCIHCINQGVSDEDSYLLHSDPELNVPVTTTREQAQQAGQVQAERRRYGSHAEISR